LVRRGHPTLGEWVSTQRKQYSIWTKGKKSAITQERIDLLNGIGFEWSVRRKTSWMDKFREMQKYREAHGDCLVRRGHPTLGEWVSTQRKQYSIWTKGKKSAITQERIDLLNGIGFEWVLRKTWMDKFKELRKYREAHGECLVHRAHPTLGVWVSTQRSQYSLWTKGKKSEITQEQIDLLNGIGFKWAVCNK